MSRAVGTFLALGLGVATAAPPTHPVVPGFERFHAGEKQANASGGRLLLGELGCVNCHGPAESATTRRQGPVLDAVGSRVRVNALRNFLRDPHAAKPGTPMPALFAGDPKREDKVEALVHFLASTGSPRHERPDPKAANAGRDLYHKVGCVACHGTRDAKGDAETLLPTSVPLPNLKAKYTIPGLSAFLENPHHARPGGRMPKLLTAKEPRDVANYLLQGIKVNLPGGQGSTTFAYYEGNWDKLPEFKRLKPKDSGRAAGFDLKAARRDSNYALKFDGFFKAEREATYEFSVNSDDGSQLLIDDQLVVNNDGIHAPQTSNGKVKLTAGVHRVTLLFMQGGGGAELSATVTAPGLGTQDLGNLVAATEADLVKKPVVKQEDDEDAIEILPVLVEQGKALFASAGCASCHTMSDGKKVIASTLKAPALNTLRGEGGCLNADPSKAPAAYRLSDAQRLALGAAIKTAAPAKLQPDALVRHTMTAFNCYACHSRDKVGGPEAALDKSFLTTQPEMGDEGRVPPPLDGVGAKLTPEYLRQILDKGADDRPYMHARMPGFGIANVGHLVEAFAALDSLPRIAAVEFKEPLPRIKASARHLVGGEAFGCIKCHTFAGQKAEGVQGIDMVLMPKRLKRDWFHAYTADPQRIRPGTRMPAAFTADGKSVLPSVLDGRADLQIEAMWQYLSDGNKARMPSGLAKASIPLTPAEGAIIYRNFIEGAGSRGIGVGYPEKVNLAFDANELRLAMLWHGGFIDAARHWMGRGQGFEGPLGDNILTLPGGAPFAALEKADDAWPNAPAKAQGYRFLGYRLSPDDRPTFLYAFGEAKVEDLPEVVAGKEPSLRRTITLTADKPVEGLYHRAAVGTKIEATDDGWFRVDGYWKIRVGAGAKVRQTGGKAELIVPVSFEGGKAKLVQEYVW